MSPARARSEIIIEFEPPKRPDLSGVAGLSIELAEVADHVLVPDNHLGQPTVSGIEVARRVQSVGNSAIVCLNARDRNRLGAHRDLLTCAANGLTTLLFVRGDDVEDSDRSGLTIRDMLLLARRIGDDHGTTFRIGVVAPRSPELAWREEADFLIAPVRYTATEVEAWRETIRFDGDVWAAILILASANMGRRLNARNLDLTVPQTLIEAFDDDPDAGMTAAFGILENLDAAGVVDGAYMIPGQRLRPVIDRLRVRQALLTDHDRS